MFNIQKVAMHTLSPADELSDIRAEIARLKLREQVLRDGFVHHPNAELIGRWTRVEVTVTQKSRFDWSLLPDVIRNDPTYFRQATTHIVRCFPATPMPLVRAGWPIQRGGATQH